MDKNLAVNMFLKGYSCSQAVAAAFAEDCGVSVEHMTKAAIPWGGGFARPPASLCGGLGGAAMAAGILVGETDADAKNRFAAEFRRQVVEPFARKHGSMACGDMVNDKKMLMECADFSAATKEQFEARPCLSLVLSACELTENFVKGFNNK